MALLRFIRGDLQGLINPRQYEGDPLKGTLLNPTSGALKGDLVERVFIPKGPPNPKSQSRVQSLGARRVSFHADWVSGIGTVDDLNPALPVIRNRP